NAVIDRGREGTPQSRAVWSYCTTGGYVLHRAHEDPHRAPARAPRIRDRSRVPGTEDNEVGRRAGTAATCTPVRPAPVRSASRHPRSHRVRRWSAGRPERPTAALPARDRLWPETRSLTPGSWWHC